MAGMDGETAPPYLKLRGLIAAKILQGNYKDGDMLPSLRSFAHEHGANPLTVAKAYQSFQEDGLVVVKRGIGLFLAEGATERLLVSERERFLTYYWPGINAMIDRLGLDREELFAQTLRSSCVAKAPIAA
jgi:GntR family transcriptional regulator